MRDYTPTPTRVMRVLELRPQFNGMVEFYLHLEIQQVRIKNLSGSIIRKCKVLYTIIRPLKFYF